MGSYIVLQVLLVVFLLSLATTTFNRRIFNLPDAIGVPIASALLVFILQWGANLFQGNAYINVNIPEIEATVRGIDFYDFLINGVICFILMASALKFKVSDLKEHAKPIGILASLSLATCAFIFAGVMFGFQYIVGNPVPFIILLLLGSALGATDPIGVKGVLASVKAPNHLMVKLEGESLFNDAVCIALFMTIFNIVKGGDYTIMGVLHTLAFEIVVACIIGYAFGKLALMMLRTQQTIENMILVTGFLAVGSYLAALYAHASAPIACVIGGLIVGNQWAEFLKEKEIDEVNHFWHTVEGIINSFLFTLIGLELFVIDLDASMIMCGIVAFVVLHLARFIANFASFAPFRMKSYNGSLTILSWGGVRGAISLALILAVLNEPKLASYASLLLGYTFISVLMSGLVCGLGLPHVMNAFYYNPNEPKEGFEGLYQRLCHKFNRKNLIYSVEGNGAKQVITPAYTRIDGAYVKISTDLAKNHDPDSF